MAEERFHNFFETYHFMNFFLLNKVVKEKKFMKWLVSKFNIIRDEIFMKMNY